MLPKLAENPANKVVVVPTDYAGLAGVVSALGNIAPNGTQNNGAIAPSGPAPMQAPRPSIPSRPRALIENPPQQQES
jgi:hypothetical protein